MIICLILTIACNIICLYYIINTLIMSIRINQKCSIIFTRRCKMNISKLLKGRDCACGKSHICNIEKVVIEEGAINRIYDLAAKYESIVPECEVRKMDRLKRIKLFLLDMDGTIYLDNSLFDGTTDFLNYVKSIGGRYIFLTNN